MTTLSTLSKLSVLALLLAPVPLGATLYRYPLADPEAEHLARRGDGAFFVIHVDHDPADSPAANLMCLAFDGAKNFPHCYDAHRGTDYLLGGAFEAMDAGSLEVVAAADGEVIEAVDGNYDRCHADAASQDVSCDGHPIQPNYVAIAHADGRVTLYYHLKQGSVRVSVGDLVACGQPLGLVGSSGISSTPHLHFQVEDASGAWIDPYAGPESQPESLWVAQDGPFGVPAAWCEGDAPAWPDAGGEGGEVAEAPRDVVEAPVEVVDETGEIVPSAGDGVGADASAEAIDGASGDGSACSAGGLPVDGRSLLIVVGIFGVSLVRGRARGRHGSSTGTNAEGPNTSR